MTMCHSGMAVRGSSLFRRRWAQYLGLSEQLRLAFFFGLEFQRTDRHELPATSNATPLVSTREDKSAVLCSRHDLTYL